MWIDTYDDPEELTFEEALKLLMQHGYEPELDALGDPCVAPYVFLHPKGDICYTCEDEDAVVELVIDLGLEWDRVYVSEP